MRCRGYCARTGQVKPPRAHYCAVSGQLVLNMDHYCVWVWNTIGYNNYRHFLLFLFYFALAAVFAISCCEYARPFSVFRRALAAQTAVFPLAGCCLGSRDNRLRCAPRGRRRTALLRPPCHDRRAAAGTAAPE